jgi:hypothetical protein
MRKSRIMEHISLDGVMQHSADDGDFPYSDWTAPYRTPATLIRARQHESSGIGRHSQHLQAQRALADRNDGRAGVSRPQR